MINHHKIFGLLFIYLIFGSNLKTSAYASEDQLTEIWEYKIQYLNLPSTKLIFFIHSLNQPPQPAQIKLKVQAQTVGVFSFLFKVDNLYETVFSGDNFMPDYLYKKVDQKNIQQTWTIRYHQTEHLAVLDSTRRWEIPPQCHNYFSMLFFLRNQPLQLNETYCFNLDVECLGWQVTAQVLDKTVLSLNQQDLATIKMELNFAPFKCDQQRPWKTDLLTNRIAKEAEPMFIWFGDDDQRLIYRVDYDSNTKMFLERTEGLK